MTFQILPMTSLAHQVLMSNSVANPDFHTPVLLKESIEALKVRPEGVYVDATFGGGGHSRLILNRINAKGRLFGFDQDITTAQNVPEDARFVFVHANFKYLSNFLRYFKVGVVDGILADLGVSSHHFDFKERGFSYRYDAELDMRMNRSTAITAKDILNKYPVDRLQRVFSEYGEIRNSKTLARLVYSYRDKMELSTSNELNALVSRCYRGDKTRYLAQVYQALRIEVNDEVGALKKFLESAIKALSPGGRIVVISYHSIEDKIVKHFFRKGGFKTEVEKDDFGHPKLSVTPVNKKPIEASLSEISTNSRARSARMRIAEKIR